MSPDSLTTVPSLRHLFMAVVKGQGKILIGGPVSGVWMPVQTAGAWREEDGSVKKWTN